MGFHQDQHDKPWAGILENGCQGQKMETRTIFHGFKQPQCSMLLCQASGGKKINTFGVEYRKSTNSNIFFFLIKSSTSDLNALTILDHACKIIKLHSLLRQQVKITFPDKLAYNCLRIIFILVKGLKHLLSRK